MEAKRTMLEATQESSESDNRNRLGRCLQDGAIVHYQEATRLWVDVSGRTHTDHNIDLAPVKEELAQSELQDGKVVQRITDAGYYYQAGNLESGLCTVEDEEKPDFDTELAKKLGVSPADILKARVHEIQRPITFQECGDVLGVTIRHDNPNKLILLSGGILNFTDQDQINILMSGESAGGKSYTALEVVALFPEGVQRIMATASPRAFYHDHGKWDPDQKQLIVDLHQKILVFLDQPHYMLMEALRPLLSHDRRELVYKITDKNRSGALRTKTVCIIGYPTVIFCAAKIGLDEQERTRLFMLSPETSREKIAEAIRLKISRESDRRLFSEWVERHPRRRWLKARIQAIRDAGITEVIIPEQEQVYDRFMSTHGHLAPRHSRDISRILAMIKAHAMLNWVHRESENHGTIIATKEDIDAGFWLYGLVSEANELGLSPSVYEVWMNDIQPLLDEQPTGINRRQILTRYHARTGRYIADAKLRRELLPALEASGLCVQESDPLDKRQKLIMRQTLPYPPDSSPISPIETIGATSGGCPHQNPISKPPGPQDAIIDQRGASK
jgi:hypothetical protein